MSFTTSQIEAIQSAGNTIVEAGAGAGKTRTLVERCIEQLRAATQPGALKRMLVVTFTEAAAAEVRRRIREELEKRSANEPGNSRWDEELASIDSANICTLHSFCFSLIRENFFELGLDPTVSILEEHQTKILFANTLNELLNEHYSLKHADSEAIRELIRKQFRGWDKPLRDFISELHEFTQTRPHPKKWFEEQIRSFQNPLCTQWAEWHRQIVKEWQDWWLPFLRSLPSENENAHYCANLIEAASDSGTFFGEVKSREALECWPEGRKGDHMRPIKKMFEEAEFLASFEPSAESKNPLQEDWDWARDSAELILKLAKEFSERFAEEKRRMGVLDFHDLEQLTLQLLTTDRTGELTATAEEWKGRFEAIFVDEYQDINQAQDLILASLGRAAPGNRFLVGDVKQSIYRFRQASPRIFQEYVRNKQLWNSVSLQENFRSHEGIINFINPLFGWLMREEVGGVNYDSKAELRFGNREGRKEMLVDGGNNVQVELHVLLTGNGFSIDQKEEDDGIAEESALTDQSANPSEVLELKTAEKEARLVAQRLRKLKEGGLEIFVQKENRKRPVKWSDMVILLRAPGNKAETYAKAFDALEIPLQARRCAFFTTPEVTDLCSLLHVLDNPLQDIPLLAVLRSPLVGLTATELAEIRIESKQRPFWSAINEYRAKKLNTAGWRKVDLFLRRYESWRGSRTTSSLGQKLEMLLADTQYLEWVKAQRRGRQRAENIQQLLRLARDFDATHGESLYLFLRHIEEIQETAGDVEPPGVSGEDSVRLMSIHQSKGLEFPVAVVPDLGKAFNFSETTKPFLLDDTFGFCARIQPENSGQSYPSLPLWLARRRQRVDSMAEEIRVLYVALTRAENLLLLFGSASEKRPRERWMEWGIERPWAHQLLRTNSMLDWIGSFLWWKQPGWTESREGSFAHLRCEIHDDESVEQGKAERPLPSLDSELITKMLRELQFDYPFRNATEQSAKTSVTALRRKAASGDEEVKYIKFRSREADDGRERGLAYHRVMESIDLGRELDLKGLQRQTSQFTKKSLLSEKEMALVDLTLVANFWQTPLGGDIRKRTAAVQRELPFTVRIGASDFEKLDLQKEFKVPEGDFVLVQGIVDLAVLLPREIWVVDFKTDVRPRSDSDETVREYRAQLNLYAYALEGIYSRPVTRRCLYFLSDSRLIEWK